MSHILAAWPETCDCLNCRIIEVRRELSVLSDIDPTIPLTCENVSILRTETEESIAAVMTASPSCDCGPHSSDIWKNAVI